MNSKKTLLEITQDILSDMSGDQVNSIFDTEEAEQVARIVVNTYHSMMSNSLWPHTRRAIKLIPFSDNNFPTHMEMEDRVKEMISINYDVSKLGAQTKQYTTLRYKDPEEFLRLCNSRSTTNQNVTTVIDKSGIELFIINNSAPTYYTSFDDETVIFDSWDSEVDSTLQAGKVQALAYVMTELKMQDDAIPDLPTDAYSALYEESLSTAQFRIREVQDIKAEQKSARQQRWLSRKSWKLNADRKYPDYGRNRRRYRDVTFKQGR